MFLLDVRVVGGNSVVLLPVMCLIFMVFWLICEGNI